jgi:hypothetical protein
MKRRELLLLVVFLVFGFVLTAGGCGGGGDGDTPDTTPPATSSFNGTWRIASGTYKSPYSEAEWSYKAAKSTVEKFDIEVVEITEHSTGVAAEHYYYIDVTCDVTPDNNDPIAQVTFDWIDSTGSVQSSGGFYGGAVTKEDETHYTSVQTSGSTSHTETEYRLIDNDTLRYRSITTSTTSSYPYSTTEELLLKRVP